MSHSAWCQTMAQLVVITLHLTSYDPPCDIILYYTMFFICTYTCMENMDAHHMGMHLCIYTLLDE